jgi:glycosyltransferase involved in cell wall biosynthesis
VPPGTTLIYDSQNDEGSLKGAMYRDTAAGRALAQAVRRIETEAVRRATLATAVSTEDRNHLASLATLARIEIVPNGCNAGLVEYVEARQRGARRDDYLRGLHRLGVAASTAHVAVFVGSGHPPNIEAAEGLLEVAAELPDVALVLVGSHVTALRLETPPDNVVPVGVASEPQLHRLLTACDVALNPMRSGSGTNIKMLDYFAAGAPVIATAIGARGLGVSAGVEYAETDPDQVGDAIRRVLAEPAEATRRAQRARRSAERHDWSLIGDEYVAAVLATIRP